MSKMSDIRIEVDEAILLGHSMRLNYEEYLESIVSTIPEKFQTFFRVGENEYLTWDLSI